MEWEIADVEHVPLEDIREVVAALAKATGFTLYRREWFDAGAEYDFRKDTTP